MKPTNRAQFREYCLRALGKGVIEINIDPDQIEDRIDEALDFWRNFHHDATQRVYLQHQITQTDKDNQYIPVNNDVLAITRIFRSGGSSGSGNINMFDLRYQIFLNDFVSFRATAHLDYFLIRQYLAQIDELFVGEIPITFNRHTDRLNLHWDWEVDAVVGQYIIIEALVELDVDTYPQVWSDRMLQKLCIAYLKRQWGTNMSKFDVIQLLGGAQLRGGEIYSEAMQEIETLEQKIRDEFEEPPRFIVG